MLPQPALEAVPEELQGFVRPLPAGTLRKSAFVQIALWPGSTTMTRPASGFAEEVGVATGAA